MLAVAIIKEMNNKLEIIIDNTVHENKNEFFCLLTYQREKSQEPRTLTIKKEVNRRTFV
jgi:hypothetical protein